MLRVEGASPPQERSRRSADASSTASWSLDRWWLDPGPVSILQIPTEGGGFNLATEGIVRRAHAHGQAVQYWTINDIETMEHLIEIGADGIMTTTWSDCARCIDAGYEAPAGWVA